MIDYTYFTSDISVNNYLYNPSTNIVSFSIENTDLSTNILFKDNYNLTVTMVGGGGGGGSSGAYEETNPGSFDTGYSSGGGGGGGGIGKIQFSSSTNGNYSFQIGKGGTRGIGANNSGDGTLTTGRPGEDTKISNITDNVTIVASGGDGGNAWLDVGSISGGIPGVLTVTDPTNIITIDISGNGGNGGTGANAPNNSPGPGPGTDGDNSVPSSSIEVIPSNMVFIGGGGGGGSSLNNSTSTSEKGGNGGNGTGGTAGGSITRSGGEGLAFGAGGGGGGKPGTQVNTYDGTNSTYSYYYNYGGNGKQGIIYIYFSVPPPPPPPPPIRRIFTQYPNGVVVNEFGQENTNIDLLYSSIPSTLQSHYQIATPPLITGIDGTISSYVPGLEDISNGNVTVSTIPYDLSGNSVKFIWTEPIFGSCLFTYKIRVWDSQTLLYEYTGFVNIELRYNGFNGCDTGPGPIPTRLWSRDNGSCIDISGVKIDGKQITYQDLDEKRKATILQYKGNQAGFSKKQMFSRLSRGIGRQRGQTFATQSDSYTNSNTRNLNHSNNDR